MLTKEPLAKRGRGRPPGSVKTENIRKVRTITLTDAAWDYAKDQGNASQFIESLIQQDKNGK